MGQFDAAIAAYEKGLAVEPGLAMLTNGLEDAKREASKGAGGAGAGGIGAVFGAPDVLQKIMSNPQTMGFLSDPTYVQKIQELQRNPDSISQHMSDPRILQVSGAARRASWGPGRRSARCSDDGGRFRRRWASSWA
jgi:stress-induced-phosphoprotein 1